jgi:hypothetical protein
VVEEKNPAEKEKSRERRRKVAPSKVLFDKAV